jgi:hypothetical protein
MTLLQEFQLAVLSERLIQIVIALVALFVGLRFRHTLIGVLVGVAAAWVSAHLFHMQIVNPAAIAYYDSIDPESIYDGNGDNVISLLLGWLLPLTAVLFVLLIRYLWHRLRPASHV